MDSKHHEGGHRDDPCAELGLHVAIASTVIVDRGCQATLKINRQLNTPQVKDDAFQITHNRRNSYSFSERSNYPITSD